MGRFTTLEETLQVLQEDTAISSPFISSRLALILVASVSSMHRPHRLEEYVRHIWSLLARWHRLFSFVYPRLTSCSRGFVYNTIERLIRPTWRAIHRSLIQMHHESINQQRNGHKYNDYGNMHNCNMPERCDLDRFIDQQTAPMCL